MEYRFFKVRDDELRNVQRLDVITPSVSSMKISMFVSEESFVLPDKVTMEVARLYAGFNAFDTHKLKFKIYYAYQLRKSGAKWDPLDILGLNIGLKI